MSKKYNPIENIQRIALKRLYNTRDLGGFITEDGKTIKNGVLFRSGRLADLPKSTKDFLENVGVKAVVDLRLETERNEHPDTVLKDCNYVFCPLVCTATPGITYENKMRKTMENEAKILAANYETVDAYMIEMYRQMVSDESSITALKGFFNTLLSTDGAVVFHCNSGKDRVGICSMLLESLLGVSESDIIKDYVASRVFCRKKFFWYRTGLVIAPISFKLKKILFMMMRVKEVYITSAMDYLKQTYGSVNEFCFKALGLTRSDVDILNQKYLE